MTAKDLIQDTIPPLKTSDTGKKALSWMDEFRVSHLPIVNNIDFLGLISEEDILNMNAPETPLGNHTLSLTRSFVYENQHVYEVMKLIAKLKISVVPVLSQEQHYMGLITLPDLVHSMASIVAIEGGGGIITLEVNLHNYSLSEIAHIVESNDAKILSSYISSPLDSSKIELTLKIDKMDLSRILAAFSRYNYTVTASYHESEFIDDLKSRYDALMKYLNI